MAVVSSAASRRGGDAYGSTALPLSLDGKPVRVTLPGGGGGGGGGQEEDGFWSRAQSPACEQIAAFEASLPEDLNGRLLDVSSDYCVYAVKNGLIRVLHRHGTAKALLRGHAGQRVTDITFFQDGNVLATAGKALGDTTTTTTTTNGNALASKVLIWRIFERGSDVVAETLLEIPSRTLTLSRIVWHLFNPNQFFMLHCPAAAATLSSGKKVPTTATLVETTRITTNSGPTHAVCEFYDDHLIMAGAIQLLVPEEDKANPMKKTPTFLHDLAWSHSARHVLSAHGNGDLVLWDLQPTTTTTAPHHQAAIQPARVGLAQEDAAITRCLFLPHEEAASHGGDTSSTSQRLATCFITASHENSRITLWSPFMTQNSAEAVPTRLQVLALQPSPTSLSAPSQHSYVVQVCFGPPPANGAPPSCFIVTADRTAGGLVAYHCQSIWSTNHPKNSPTQALLVGCDYVVPFSTKYPTFSWSVLCAPATDMDDDEDDDDKSKPADGLNFDMKLFCYQSSVVQSLTLARSMCLPPAWPVGTANAVVQAEKLQVPNRQPKKEEIEYDEDYDLEEDDDDDDGDKDDDDDDDDDIPYPTATAPDAGALPAPIGLDGNNPFDNWLGNLAAKSSSTSKTASTPSMPPPPEAPPASALPNFTEDPAIVADSEPGAPGADVPTPSSFLSPKDFVSPGGQGKKAPEHHQNNNNSKNQGESKSLTPPRKQDRKRSPKPRGGGSVGGGGGGGLEPGKVAILKREEPSAGGGRRTARTPPKGSKDAPAPPPGMASAHPTATMEPSPAVSNNRAQTIPLAEEIRQILKSELDASAPGDRVIKAVQESLGENVVQPIQASIRDLGQQGVHVDSEKIASILAESVDETLRAAFVENIKNVLIPVLESTMGQVFLQISDRLDQGTLVKESPSTSKEMEAISSQLSTMTALVGELTKEVQTLRSEVAEQQRRSADVADSSKMREQAHPQVDPLEATRQEIRSLLQARNYEEAFTKAVSASTAEMAVFCCQNADLNDVLGGSTPCLSQPILLCLMQQLGTVLVANSPYSAEEHYLLLELQWLQEIALSLNPTDAKIQRHIPTVLQQLVMCINQRMERGEPALRRPLQRLLQVVRGMQMG